MKNVFLKFCNSLSQNRVVGTVILVSSFYAFCLIFNCFLYEANDDPSFEFMMRGYYWNTPITNFYFWFIGISHIYVFLYSNLDFGLNYYGISLIFFSWLSHIIMAYVILDKSKKRWVFWALLFLVVSFSNIYNVSFTRVSILGTFSGLILFNIFLFKKSSKLTKTFVFILSTILIVFSFLMRPEGGLLGFIFFLPFIAWNFLFEMKGRIRLNYFYLFFPIFLALIVKISVQRTEEFERTKFMNDNINKIVEIVDYGRVPIINNIEEERIFFQIKNLFFFNKEVFNAKNDSAGHCDILSFFKLDFLKSKVNAYIEYLLNNPLYILLLFFAIFCCIKTFSSSPAKGMLFVLTISFIILLSIFIIGTMKIRPRVFHPIYTIFGLFAIVHSFRMTDPTNLFSKMNLIIAGIFLLIFLGSSDTLFLFKRKQFIKDDFERLKRYTLNEPQTTIFFLKIPAFNYFPLKHFDFNKEITRIPMRGWPSYNNAGYRMIQEITNSNELTEILGWIQNNPELANIFSDDETNNFFRELFAYYKFEGSLTPVKVIDHNKGVGYYTIEKNHE